MVCGEQRFEDEREDTLLNPTVIVEVLSESCEAYDRGKKFELYRLIPSLREYILVSQWEPRIEQFLRQGSGEWLLRDAAGLESNLTLPALDVVVPLAGIYAKVDFAVEAARRDVRYFAQTQAVDDP